MEEVIVPDKLKVTPSFWARMWSKPMGEYRYFAEKPVDMRRLLITNMIYALVIPVIEIFVNAYIMRRSNNPVMVAIYQLTVYSGIPISFLINGYLLSHFKIKHLYSFGMLLSGISILAMMNLTVLDGLGIGVAGMTMGISFGFFWSNRDFLALSTTHDSNRNYYYGLETFFYTISFIVVPFLVGYFISTTETLGWFAGSTKMAYQLVAVVVCVLTVLASAVALKSNFTNPQRKQFVYFKYHKLWRKMLGLAALKGIVQGYLVIAPAILVMRLVGNEGSLGTIQAICGVLTAIMLYILGRLSGTKHRIYIFAVGISIFLVGSIFNGVLFSATGVIIFMLCKVLFQPLHDIAYFPIQMKAIDVVSKLEDRNEFAYILNHEFGLYVGRFFGLVLFILLAFYVSETFALKYSLIVIALLQMIAWPVAQQVTKHSNQFTNE